MKTPKRKLKWVATRYEWKGYAVVQFGKRVWWGFSTRIKGFPGLSSTFKTKRAAIAACERHAREMKAK